MKKALLTAALIMAAPFVTIAAPLESAAKTLTTAEMKQYQPQKSYKYYYKSIYKDEKGKTSSGTLIEAYDKNEFYDSFYPLQYWCDNKSFGIEAYFEDPVLKIKAPYKLGKVTTVSIYDTKLKYKLVSNNKKIKVGGKTYKNVLYIKDLTDHTHMYLAKNVGLILEKSTDKNSRTELVKIKKK